MITLELSEAESRVLQQALESYLSDLRMEIADTDNMDFRVALKERKRDLQSIVSRLSLSATA